MRIASLLPAATEVLHALDAIPQLAGRSHECDFPNDASSQSQHLAGLPVLTSQNITTNAPADIDRQVTGAIASGQSLYDLDAQKLQELRPDLIITQDLCEVCSVDLEHVRRVARDMVPSPGVLSLNPTTLGGVLDDILRVGDAIGRADHARAAVARFNARVDRALALVPAFVERPRVLFLEWTDPPFTPGHWTPQLIDLAGADHPLNPARETATSQDRTIPGPRNAERTAPKSFRVTPEDILAADRERPFDRVIVCPCGMSIEQTEPLVEGLVRDDASWFASLDAVAAALEEPPATLAGARIAIVDGNQMFSRPGPRLVDALEFLAAWLHDRPNAMPAGFPAVPYPRPRR